MIHNNGVKEDMGEECWRFYSSVDFQLHLQQNSGTDRGVVVKWIKSAHFTARIYAAEVLNRHHRKSNEHNLRTE